MREGVIIMTTSLLPLDTFVVINKTILNDQDRLILTSLYSTDNWWSWNKSLFYIMEFFGSK